MGQVRGLELDFGDREGAGLAGALTVGRGVVPSLVIGMVRAGERGSQLGAALAVSGPAESRIQFVCLDQHLAMAAEREGFRVLSAHG